MAGEQDPQSASLMKRPRNQPHSNWDTTPDLPASNSMKNAGNASGHHKCMRGNFPVQLPKQILFRQAVERKRQKISGNSVFSCMKVAIPVMLFAEGWWI
jgi:hypothetical protein